MVDIYTNFKNLFSLIKVQQTKDQHQYVLGKETKAHKIIFQILTITIFYINRNIYLLHT